MFQSSVRVLRDASNSVHPVKSKRHKLFPSTSSQVLDDTTDNNPPLTIGNIENVHLTERKNCKKTAAATMTSKSSKNSSTRTRPQVRSERTQSSTRSSQRKVLGYIAMTQVEKEDRSLAQELTKRLGVLGYSKTVTSNTTHLVCGQKKRTINTLKAMLRGCWILSKDWLLESLEEGQWLDETDYELLDFSPAVRELREERQMFRGVFQSELFKGKIKA